MTSTRQKIERRGLRGTGRGQITYHAVDRVSPIDVLSTQEVLALLPQQPIWLKAGNGDRQACLRGATRIMEWLQAFPGAGWQQRWENSGADQGVQWITALTANDPRSADLSRQEIRFALPRLFAARLVLPSFDFLTDYGALNLYVNVRKVLSPDLFEQAEKAGTALGMRRKHVMSGLNVLTKVVLNSGKNLEELTEQDLLRLRAWHLQENPSRGTPSVNGAWDMLAATGVLPENSSMRETVRAGQKSTAQLIDRYDIKSQTVRNLLIRYFDERRPGIDFATLRGLISYLAGTFWCDIEEHHPGIDSINLPTDVARKWKERVRSVTMPDGSQRPRIAYLDLMVTIRSFYEDLVRWSMEDPSWAAFAVPNPIKAGDTVGLAKARRAATSRMHQRTRERLPHLLMLVETTTSHLKGARDLLRAAGTVEVGQRFDVAGRTYLRTTRKSYLTHPGLAVDVVLVQDVATGEVLDLTRVEDDAFWAWAAIETLRYTGLRIEELLELTHLAVVSYRLPDTGEVVPLLQVVPSKANQERLLLVVPELASVLASIISRISDDDGCVPLVARYDPHERLTGPRLPHLFQRKYSWQPVVIGNSAIVDLIDATLARTGLTDPTGALLSYRPHDFRRMFTTEVVSGGLPIHIAARILGHDNINTTQAYHAVFPKELIRAYRAFTDRRRALRPAAEYREPTAVEWTEFQHHFALRKVELGECGRPYGSPCNHEHACIRCPMLRPDPTQRARLVEIIDNLAERKAEAVARGWLGEIDGLDSSLTSAREKLTALDKRAEMTDSRAVLLGIPVIREDA